MGLARPAAGMGTPSVDYECRWLKPTLRWARPGQKKTPRFPAENEGLQTLAGQCLTKVPPVGLEQTTENAEKSGGSDLERSKSAPNSGSSPDNRPDADTCDPVPTPAETVSLTPDQIVAQAANLPPEEQTALITALLQQLTARTLPNAEPDPYDRARLMNQTPRSMRDGVHAGRQSTRLVEGDRTPTTGTTSRLTPSVTTRTTCPETPRTAPRYQHDAGRP